MIQALSRSPMPCGDPVTKIIHSCFNKELAFTRGAAQEIDIKFRFAIYRQGIPQFHDNCKIAMSP